MNNLKRVLSLALASVMLIGMMAVGASATDVSEFSDGESVTHAEAVSTMATLGVIKGYPDGTYLPEKVVTRAEMTAIITRVLNGGVEPTLGTATSPLFTDVSGWARPYVEYCANLGIVAGMGDGTFHPDDPVTGAQAAKMLLCAAGYKSDIYGFTGSDWELNVNRIANQQGLYKGLSLATTSEGLKRDDTAQMAYNTLPVTPIVEYYDQNLATGTTTVSYRPETDGTKDTMMEKYFGVNTNDTILTGWSYDSDKAAWTYSFSTIANQSSKEDYTGLFGQKVSVLSKTENGKTTNLGIFAKDSSVLAEGYAGQLPEFTSGTATSGSFAGTTVKLTGTAATTPIVDVNAYSTTLGYLTDVDNDDAAWAQNYSFKVIDNTGDGKADLVVKTPFKVAKITYVGTTSLTMNNGVGSKNFTAIEKYDGAAKDDHVLYVAGAYTAKEIPVITKLEPVSGTVTGKKDAEWQIGSDWFVNISTTDIKMADTIDYIALGDNIYYAKVTSETTGSRAVGMIYQVGIRTANGVSASAALEAKMLLADGTSQTIEISKINGKTVGYGASYDNDLSNAAHDDVTTDNLVAGKAADGSNIAAATVQATLIGELVNYKVDNNGKYEVAVVANTTAAPTEGILGYVGIEAGKTFTTATDKLGTYELADDAVVFVFVGANATATAAANKAFVYTGKEIKNTGANYGAGGTTYGNVLYGKTNGFTYAQVAVLAATAKPDVKTGASYGYLVSDAYTTYDAEAKKDYVIFTYWDGEKNVTAKAEGTDYEAFTAGTTVTFDTVSDGVIKNVSVPVDLVTGKVTGWDGAKKLQLDTTNSFEIDSDTVILYINSAKKTGAAGDTGIIAEAADVDTTVAGTENNVRWLKAGSKLALLVVDVNNYMRSAPAVVVSSVADAIKVLDNSGNATLDGSIATGAWSTILTSLTKGKTLTVTGDVTAEDATQALAGNLVVGGTFTTDDDNAFTVSAGASLKTKVLAGTAGQLALTAETATGKGDGSKVTVTEPTDTAIDLLENAAAIGKAGATVVLGTAPTSADANAAFKWCTAAGAAKGTAANSGTAGTFIGAGSDVPAGTYKTGDAFSDDDQATADETNIWVKQAE